MTAYLLFAALGVLISAGVAYAHAIAGFAVLAAVVLFSTHPPDDARFIAPTGSPAAETGSAPTQAVAAGQTLYQKRGCIGCHRPDGTGVGPTLHGLFGGPVQDPTCGVAIVDESYVREAILNPSATVAAGYPAVMPSFTGLLTEEELQALIAYVKSLRAPA